MDVTEPRETFRQTLVYAMAIAGSDRALALRLDVTVALLRNWLEGIAEIPSDVFLRAVDVVVAATPEEISRSRGLLIRRTKI